MSRFRVNSSPELLPSTDEFIHRDDSVLGGVAANVKLLLKLIQDENDACKEDDGRRPQRVAGMITILDDVRTRIEKAQFARKKPVLQRCKTDIRRGGGGEGGGAPPGWEQRKPQDPAAEENQKLRRELSASMTARKSLEKMFSGLGKEKEIIAAELARKVRELSDMEELLEDLRAQNETLTEKVKACAAEHRGKKGGADSQGSAVLQERNRAISEQLLKALDGYRSAKRRLKDAQGENERVQAKAVEVAEGVAAGVDRLRGVQGRIGEGCVGAEEIAEVILSLEKTLVGCKL